MNVPTGNEDQEFLDQYWDACLSFGTGKIKRREFGRRMKALGHFPGETDTIASAIRKALDNGFRIEWRNTGRESHG